jgi:acetyl-CoA acetyltransferase family protein
MQLRNVVLVDGVRSPFARGGRGKLVATRLDDVGATIIRALLERNPKVKPSMIEDVGLGNVAQSGEFIGLGHVARLAGLPMEVSAFNSNRQCGSSMETLQRLVSGIAVGALDCGISLGIERMGRTLGGGGGGARPNVTRVNQPRRLELNKSQHDMSEEHNKYFSVPFPDYILDSPAMVSMLQTAQNVADTYGITRKELDEFTVKSHKKYGEAFQKGVYKDELISLEIEEPVYDDEGNWVPDSKGKTITFDIDEGYRPGTNFEALQNLKPVQGYVSYANKELVITAGNSCPTNDGVSAALLMSEDKARELGLEPIARIVGMGVAGVKPQLMGIGPIPSTHKAARHAGITMDQIDRVEFNEAFASQVIPTLRDLGIAEEKVNVNGGSLAIGHPMGATGARLVTTVSKELRRSGKKYGLATQCIGAGMGISTIVEALY